MTAVIRLALPALVLVAAGFSAQQAPVRDNPTPPRVIGSATIAGKVIDDVTGQPVRRAVLSLANQDRGLRLAMVTGDTGTFSFTNLPDGRFGMSANKPGYVGMSYGATRPNRPGTSIVLTPGQQLTGLTVRLPPGAVIAGTIRDRAGEPMSYARVTILRQSVSYLTGERELQPAGFSSGIGTATNDRGEYRAYGLPAGEYYVVAFTDIGIRNESELREVTQAELDWARRLLQTPGASVQPPERGRPVDYAPMFYPGVPTQASAGVVTVKAGEERAGIDMVVDRIPTAKITGQVVMPGDAPLPPLQVNVIAHDTIPGIPFSGFGSARPDARGHFVSAGLPPGDYTVTVRVGGAGRAGAAGAGSSALFGMSSVTVSGDDVDTTITLGPGVTVSGRLVFDGTSAKPPADMTRVRVNLTAERGRTPTLGVPSGTADATGAFKFVGVTPGRYRLNASGAAGWFVRAATVQGKDTLDQPFEIGTADIGDAEIRFTDLQTEISGDLLDAAGRPAPEYQIIVFPADRAFWQPGTRRIQSQRPGADGHFRFLNLPPGEYLIAAVTDVEPGEWYDPKFLAQLLGAATKIALGEGEKKVQSLKIKGS